MRDEEVVKKILAGEHHLFEILISRYNQLLYRIARAVLKDDSEAENVVQDTYFRAFSKLHQFSGAAKFSTWLTKIALHESLARSRARRKFVELVEMNGLKNGMKPIKRIVDTPESVMLKNQIGEILQSAIESLADKYRLVFVLREIEGLSTDQTAECLGLGKGAVKSRLHRARAQLRKKIDLRISSAIRSLYKFAGRRCDHMLSVVLKPIRAHRVATKRE